MRDNSTPDIVEYLWFGHANRINSGNFNATTLKLAEKFYHIFSHIFIFGNTFAHGNVFDAVMVTSSKYLVSLYL